VGPRRLLLGALVGGVATGIRVQAAVLVVPVLLVALGEERRGGVWSTGFKASVAFGCGCLLWAIPLVVATGGVQAYLAALHSQAGEDFAWVDMLWSNPTPRHIAVALRQTFVLPWASASLASVVGWLAAAGAAVMLVRERYALWVLLASSVPYVLFHLAFQETITVRYALPAVPMVVWFVARAISVLPRVRLALAVPLLTAAAIVAVPGGLAYGRDPHPAFRWLYIPAGQPFSPRPGYTATTASVGRCRPSTYLGSTSWSPGFSTNGWGWSITGWVVAPRRSGSLPTRAGRTLRSSIA
jgi:hypothetical protein